MTKASKSILILAGIVVVSNTMHIVNFMQAQKNADKIIEKQKDELMTARRERDNYFEVSNKLRKEKDEWKEKYEEVCRNLG